MNCHNGDKYLYKSLTSVISQSYKNWELFLVSDNSKHVYHQGDTKSKSDLDKYIDLFVDHTTENIFELFPKKNDAQIADAILELFRKRETIEVFNKKALYIYIREIVDVKTPKITKIADKLHKIFRSSYVFYLENGYAKFYPLVILIFITKTLWEI